MGNRNPLLLFGKIKWLRVKKGKDENRLYTANKSNMLPAKALKLLLYTTEAAD